MANRKTNRRRSQKQIPASDEPIRLNRYIARAGICSRRKADELIASGRVKVNGEVVVEMGLRVAPSDRVVVNGTTIESVDAVHILLNKPINTITTVSDEKGRRTVLDLITRDELKTGLFPVGRLDRDTTGLLLLTNDGDLANRLMHPRWEVEKTYLVTTRRRLQEVELSKLKEGVQLDDGVARADHAIVPDPAQPKQIAIRIHEGRNRQIRRMLEAVGHEVLRLDRVGYAGLDLSGLRRGRWRRLKPSEVQRLRKLVRL